MKAARVVEALNVSKDARLGSLTSWITMTIDLFGLELCKEALDGRIVITIAGARHANGDVVLGIYHIPQA
jgi:hypothetical protein